MSDSFVLVGTTCRQAARALVRLTGKSLVLCPNIGDGASPVHIILPHGFESHGQAADYRHDVNGFARRIGFGSVCGYWDSELGWLSGVDPTEPLTDRQLHKLLQELRCQTLEQLRAREAARHKAMLEHLAREEAERPAREAARLVRQQRIAEAREQYRELFEAALRRVPLNRRGRPRQDMARRLQ